MAGRPRTGQTPVRHVRVSDSLWQEVAAIAREQERAVSAVVLDALRRYIMWYRGKQRRDRRSAGD